MERAELIIQILDSIPDNLPKPTMILHNDIDNSNAQEYTIENCNKYNVPFIPIFKDIDTYINENGNMRMQGYLPLKSIFDLYLNIEQLQFILDMTKSGKWVAGRKTRYNYDATYTLEVYNHPVFKP